MNKKLIALLTLVMFVASFTGMAFAATTNTVLRTANIKDDNKQAVTANFRIYEKTEQTGSVKSGDEITFRLLNGVEFEDADTASTVTKAKIAAAFKLNDVALTATDVTSFSEGGSTFTIQLPNNLAGAGATAGLVFDGNLNKNIFVDASGAAGNLELEVTADSNSGLTEGTLVIGTVAGGETTAVALNTESLVLDRSGQEIGDLKITESVAGQIKHSLTDNDITLELPADMEWEAPVAANVVLRSGFSALTFADLTIAGAGTDKLTINFKKTNALVAVTQGAAISSAKAGIIEFNNLKVKVTKDASIGDVEVNVDGYKVTDQDVVLAKVGDYGIVVTADSAKTIYVGENEEKLANFYFEENASGSVVPQRPVRLVLPEGFAWSEDNYSAETKDGDLKEITSKFDISDDRKELTFEFGKNAGNEFSSEASKIKFKEFKIAVAADAPLGDLDVTIEGRAGVEGTVKVAEIKAPITVETEATDVVIGKQEQKLADILITEAEKEVLDDGKTLVLDLRDFKFSKTPKVEVVEGDVRIDTVKKDGKTLTITFDRDSRKASTIKISEIEVDLDRTVAEGNYDFRIYGSALNEVFAERDGKFEDKKGNKTNIKADDDKIVGTEALDVSETTRIIEFVGAKVVTPAPEESGAVKEVKMTVGSTVYTTDGVEMTMDAAPYLKNGRTYFPVRYVAQAVGITAENVVWDPSERTVTIFKAERIVQVKIGSAVMLVNGIPVTMDSAPEVTNGRTMLPIRFVAQALGLVVDWDAATQTVSLN